MYLKELHCFPVSSLPGRTRNDIEDGGKILLPPSVLDALSRMNISFPMLFKLTNPTNDMFTHCGVLEFLADEDTIITPSWIMNQLMLQPSDILKVQTVILPVATYTRFQPQSVLFLDITNPKAVLENSLRRFACLTTGDIFSINYNNKIYYIKVEETKPEDAVLIIECDMDVDFSPPVDYVGATPEKSESPINELVKANKSFRPFSGLGMRLDGKDNKIKYREQTSTVEEENQYGTPDLNYKMGTTIEFFRSVPSSSKKIEDTKFEAFSGHGKPLTEDEENENDTR